MSGRDWTRIALGAGSCSAGRFNIQATRQDATCLRKQVHCNRGQRSHEDRYKGTADGEER